MFYKRDFFFQSLEGQARWDGSVGCAVASSKAIFFAVFLIADLCVAPLLEGIVLFIVSNRFWVRIPAQSRGNFKFQKGKKTETPNFFFSIFFVGGVFIKMFN